MRGEAASSKTQPATGEISGKHLKIYVDILNRESKTCLIHDSRNSSDECKVLGDFGDKYDKIKPTNDHGNHPIPRKTLIDRYKITLL